MPIGDSQKYVSGGKTKFLYTLLGTFDLHSHIRVAPLVKYIGDYFNKKDSRTTILELGCGSGLIAFEIAKLADKYNKQIDYLGIDLNKESIDFANKIFRKTPFKDIKFVCDDVTALFRKEPEYEVDIIVLFDIIEHISNANDLLYAVYSYLKPGGLFIISVPTKRYPLVFGRKFHERIGHIVDGYSIEELDTLFIDQLKCKKKCYSYNTGLISKYGCGLFYKIISFDNKYINMIKSIILYPFKYLDICNSYKVSCSLFVIYKK